MKAKIYEQEPWVICHELMTNNFSEEQFDRLVACSSFFFQEHGSAEMLKIFIPNSPQNAISFFHDWSVEKSEKSFEALRVQFIEKLKIANGYYKERHDSGLFVAFNINTMHGYNYNSYLWFVDAVETYAKENNISITAKDVLRYLPFEVCHAWKIREFLLDKLSLKMLYNSDRDFTMAIHEGRHNFFSRWKDKKAEDTMIANWHPTSEFVQTSEPARTKESMEKALHEYKEKKGIVL